MYEIHHRRFYNSRKDFALIGKAYSLEEAKAMRMVSGDLVVYRVGNKVVDSDDWLWDWEKVEFSYANRARKADR